MLRIMVLLIQFSKDFQQLKRSVSNFKPKCLELKSADLSQLVNEIKTKSRGLTSLLPDELMTKTNDIIKPLRLNAASIS